MTSPGDSVPVLPGLRRGSVVAGAAAVAAVWLGGLPLPPSAALPLYAAALAACAWFATSPPLQSAWPWWLLFGASCLQLSDNLLFAANHDYLLSYALLAAALATSLTPPDANGTLRQSARWLLALTMGLATLQKLISGRFVSGETLGFLYLTGEFTRSLAGLGVVLPHAPQLEANAAAVLEFNASTPGLAQTITLTAPASYSASMAAAGSIAVILAEAAIAVGIVARARWIGRIGHATLLLFLAGLLALRPEVEFAAILAMLGVWASSSRRLRIGYGFMLCAAVTLLLSGRADPPLPGL